MFEPAPDRVDRAAAASAAVALRDRVAAMDPRQAGDRRGVSRRYAVKMRTTVTLDADTEALVRRLMAERGVSFKRALNDAIRSGAPAPAEPRGSVTRKRRMGTPSVNLDRALVLVGDLEDDDLIRRMQVGK